MVKRVLPGLGLTGFWPLGDDTYKDEMDSNLRALSALVNGNVASRLTALPGTPSTGDIYIVPDDAVSNADELAIWDGESGSEAWVFLTPNTGWSFYVVDENKNYQWNGADWVEFAGAGTGSASGNYDLRVAFSSTPSSLQVVDTIPIGRALTFPVNFAGSVASVATNPTASFVLSVRDDGTEIGTITVGTDGSSTFATTGGVEVTVLPDSLLTFLAPSSADATIANFACTLLGGV